MAQKYKVDAGLGRRIEDLRNQSLGTDKPFQYRSTFEQGFKNLNQGPNAPESVISSGTQSLADAFITRFYEKTGKLPAENQIQDFVSATLTPIFAEQYIQGINADQLKTQFADPYIQFNQDELTPADNTAVEKEIADREAGLSGRLDEIFKRSEAGVTDRINRQFDDIRGKAVAEEAALGRRGSPASRYTTNAIDVERGRSLSDAIASLAGQRATGELDVSKAIEGILAGERRAKEAGSQFNKELGLRRMGLDESTRQFDLNRGLQERGFGLAERLGKLQADAYKPGTLDYINTAFKGLDTLANVKKAFK